MLDLLHSNSRGNINSFLWPKALFDMYGRFDQSFRIAGDIEWMSRHVGENYGVIQTPGPLYVQARDSDRLSSTASQNGLLASEVRRVAETIRLREQSGRSLAAALNVWVRTTERRARGPRRASG
jgi:hypothetical protein